MIKILFKRTILVIFLLIFSLSARSSPIYSNSYNITTVTGVLLSQGYIDGKLGDAEFNNPAGIVSDSNGNIYIADSFNYVIREINITTGAVTTIAGLAGTKGNTDGMGLNARFGTIKGIAIDINGNLYVTDTSYNTVRKISQNGGKWTTTTLIPTNGGLLQPIGITTDTIGNIYVADYGNYVIRKISSTGSMTTLAGSIGQIGLNDGSGTNAQFAGPTGVAIDASGNLFVTDCPADTIREISTTGVVKTISGYYGVPALLDGALNTSIGQFDHPYAITIASNGTIFITDGGNGTYIRMITGVPNSNNLSVSTIAGFPGIIGQSDGIGRFASFNNLTGINVGQNGTIFVSDGGNQLIRQLSPISLNSPPTIITQPSAANSINGINPVFLYVSASGAGNLNYQWYFNGTALTNNTNITGATTSSLSIQNVQPNQTGDYHVTVSNEYGSISSNKASVTLNGSIAPQIISQPLTQTINLNSSLSLNINASGTNLSYQWYHNGLSIPGANTSSYQLSNVNITDAGTYYATISNSAQVLTSANAIITIATPAGYPTITSLTNSQSINTGTAFTLSVNSDALNQTSYQWFLNGIAINGANSASYTVNSAQSVNAGSYTVSVKNNLGSITSTPIIISIIAQNSGRLINLSVLSMDGPGSQLLTVGFVTGGTGTLGSQNLLIRGSGPALAAYSITNYLPDPTLTIFNDKSIAVATNDNWGTPTSNIAIINSADVVTGAFALTPTTSLDAALVANLQAGGYSVQIAGKNGASGFAIAEVYDATIADTYINTSPRLVNLSCLEQISVGGALTAGFIIGGSTSEKVLIRASGPTLAAAPFNIPGTLKDPKLTVYDSSSKVLATNTGWAGNATITAANKLTGAFQFINNSSNDSAVLLMFQPGAYTVQVQSDSGTSGITLIEIYEVPNN